MVSGFAGRQTFFIGLLVVIFFVAYCEKSLLFNDMELDDSASKVDGNHQLLKQYPAKVQVTRLSDGKSDGKTVELESIQGRSLTFVHFWATWCPPCEAEFPDLVRLLEKFKKRDDARFLLVAVNDEEVKIKKFLKRFPEFAANTLVLIDNNKVYENNFGTTRVPESFIFGSDGSVLKHLPGPQSWANPYYTKIIEEFLAL